LYVLLVETKSVRMTGVDVALIHVNIDVSIIFLLFQADKEVEQDLTDEVDTFCVQCSCLWPYLTVGEAKLIE